MPVVAFGRRRGGCASRFALRAGADLARSVRLSADCARIGEQPLHLGGSRVWILPNPGGLNAPFPPRQLAQEFARLRRRWNRRPLQGRLALEGRRPDKRRLPHTLSVSPEGSHARQTAFGEPTHRAA